MTADAPREAGDVADARAGACLTSGDVPLDDERLEAFRRRVHGGRETSRTGSDDRDVVHLGAGARLSADRLDEVEIGGADEDAAVVPHGHRHLAPGLPDLLEQGSSLIRVGRMERVRHREAGEEVADLVGATAVLGRDDPEEREPVAVGARPAREELGHGGVEPELRRPRLGEVVVDLTVRHRRDDRIRGRVVALHEQDPLRVRMERVGPFEELDAGQSRHPLVGDQQCDSIGPAREFPQPSESLPRHRPRRRCANRSRTACSGRRPVRARPRHRPRRRR